MFGQAKIGLAYGITSYYLFGFGEGVKKSCESDFMERR